jgi:dTDP-4-amino-4,6-dideoxygalactose transaminase
VANGTEALHLTLRALDIGPGDEVITAANTYVATALAIAYTGATPVLVDVNPDDYLIDAELIEEAITPRTKAIIPVHLYGQPADMAAIQAIADKYGLPVVQDACQAHGARIGENTVGSHGTASCFSFYPSKNLGAFGDGGCIVTNCDQLAEKLRVLRNLGQRSKNDFVALGYNCRLDSLQAAVLEVKLRYLDEANQRRRAIADQYRELLSETDLVLPIERPDVMHVYHLYIVQHEQRDALMAHLQANDVQCGIHYPDPIHQIPQFQNCRTVPENAPVSSQLAKRILSLPMFPDMTDEQVQRVVSAVLAFHSNLATV